MGNKINKSQTTALDSLFKLFQAAAVCGSNTKHSVTLECSPHNAERIARFKVTFTIQAASLTSCLC